VPVFAALWAASIAYGAANVSELRDAVYDHRVALVGFGIAFLGSLMPLLPSMKSKSAAFPFLLGLVILLIGIVAAVIVVYPNIVPFRLSIWDASSSRLSQIFLLTGALIVTPVVIAYSLFAYWVFRGKTPPEGWES